jgi:hypothetical protein
MTGRSPGAEVPGVTSSRMLLMKSSLMSTPVIEPTRPPVATPIAAPNSGTKKGSSNRDDWAANGLGSRAGRPDSRSTRR